MDDLVLVDVGASGGIHRRWNRLLPDLRAILFEPDETAYQGLLSQSQPHIQVANTALFQTTGEYPFYVCRTHQVSSVYRPNQELIGMYPQPERYDVVDTLKVPMTSLDLFFQETGSPQPQFIKLDTQGSELAILRGGARVLPQTIGVEIEVEHVALYQDAPLFPEVDTFMRNQGFVLYDLCHYYWKLHEPEVGFDSSMGDLIFSDALYFRPPVAILGLARDGLITIDQAVRCYLAYGYTHLSEVVAAQAASRGLLDQTGFQALRDLIRRFKTPRALSWLPKSQALRWRLVRLADKLFPWSGWAWKSKADLGSRHGTR